jgi:hypothetical protein
MRQVKIDFVLNVDARNARMLGSFAKFAAMRRASEVHRRAPPRLLLEVDAGERARPLAHGWCMAALESPASLTGRPVMPAPQSNLIAPWLRKVIQQTMVANARARPTSGQTRSNAVNTTPNP